MDNAIKTVLILDDEKFVRQSFADFFEDRLWHTLQAESAEQALDILETASPHAAIVDVRLPGMNGDAFIRRAFNKKPKMIFTVCTGSTDYILPEDLSILPTVCSDVFFKPVSNMAEMESCLLRMMSALETTED